MVTNKGLLLQMTLVKGLDQEVMKQVEEAMSERNIVAIHTTVLEELQHTIITSMTGRFKLEQAAVKEAVETVFGSCDAVNTDRLSMVDCSFQAALQPVIDLIHDSTIDTLKLDGWRFGVEFSAENKISPKIKKISELSATERIMAHNEAHRKLQVLLRPAEDELLLSQMCEALKNSKDLVNTLQAKLAEYEPPEPAEDVADFDESDPVEGGEPCES